MAEYKNVLVGIDGSKQSIMAFHKAIDIAKRNNSKLHLLSVVNGEHYQRQLVTALSIVTCMMLLLNG